MFTTTERLVLFRDIHWKPSTDSTVTVSNHIRKVSVCPSNCSTR